MVVVRVFTLTPDLPLRWVRAVFGALSLALLVGACSEPPLPEVPADGTILAFGDSLTAGVGAGRGEEYPAVLAALSGRRVVNAGRSGETTAGGRARFATVVADTRPDLIILLEGGNDILRRVRPDETKRNLAAMLDIAAANGISLVLVGVPDRVLFSDAAGLYAELADEYGVPLEDTSLAKLLRDDNYKADPIHLNAAGYRAFAGALYQQLVALGAL